MGIAGGSSATKEKAKEANFDDNKYVPSKITEFDKVGQLE